MMRIGLFLLTNLAVIVLASITLSLLGVTSILQSNGVDLDLTSLLIFCAVFGMAGSIISLLISKPMAKWSTGARTIDQPSSQGERWLVATTQELAREAGIGMPEVAVFQAPQPNAFATGWNRNNSLVAVSTGLLQHMSQDEVKAVLAHEIGHVANGDMVTLALIQGVVNTFVMFFARIIGHTVDRVVFKTEEGHGIGYYLVTIVSEIVLGILASMIVMWFSRLREYRADAAGARLAGRGNMIAALERLKAGTQMHDALPETLTAFGINSGLRSGLAAMLASHPPLDDRIEALRNAP
jgi:heat shock protein HtpX